MKCSRAAKLIWLYVEGDLDSTRQRDLREHLVHCDSCRELLEEARPSQRWLRSFPAPEFNEEFFAVVREQALERIAESRRLRLRVYHPALDWKQVLGCATAVMLFCAIGLYFKKTLIGRTAETPGQIASNGKSTNTGSDTGNVTPANDKRPAAKLIRRPGLRPKSEPARFSDQRGDDAAISKNSTYAERPLRIEIQTADPDVRIIWFVPGGGQPAPTADADDTM